MFCSVKYFSLVLPALPCWSATVCCCHITNVCVLCVCLPVLVGRILRWLRTRTPCCGSRARSSTWCLVFFCRSPESYVCVCVLCMMPELTGSCGRQPYRNKYIHDAPDSQWSPFPNESCCPCSYIHLAKGGASHFAKAKPFTILRTLSKL